MSSDEMSQGFSVPAGRDRFGEHLQFAGEPNDCKVSTRDTDGAMCIFEFTGGSCGPRHFHYDQDEWIYLIDGEFEFEVGDKRFHAGAGEPVFILRNIPHVCACVNGIRAGLLMCTSVREALPFDVFCRLFHDHGMKVVGPPLTKEWKVAEDGRITQIA